MKEKKSLKAICTGMALFLITIVSPILFMAIGYLASTRYDYIPYISSLSILLAGNMMLALVRIATKIILNNTFDELREKHPSRYSYFYETCNLSILFLGPMVFTAIVLIILGGVMTIVEVISYILTIF